MNEVKDNNVQRQDTVVATLYKFVHLPDFRELRETLIDVCEQASLKGTLLLAEEGINGTVAGSRQSVATLLDFLKKDCRFADVKYQQSSASQSPFYRMKIRLKKEIVTMGVADVDPEQSTGTKVEYKEWNQLIADPEVLVIDTRNDYEHQIGTFKNAISPCTQTFREFPEFVKQHLDVDKHKKIAMFCTGGIRCEKATNYLLKHNFREVYHLSGGILKYLEEVNRKDGKDNLWQGDCFVFDGRVAVDKHLQQGNYVQCFACRTPLTKDDLEMDAYVEGISCHHCIKSMTDEKYACVSERQRQVKLAEHAGQAHIGVPQQSSKD